MERRIQSLLQRTLGFERYLYWFSRFKIRTLRWDRNEGDVLHFISLMPPDGVVLDIGANVGIMTALIARRVWRGQVHAFEPIPENFAALRRVVEHYRLGNVVLHPMALGESAGELRMVMPEESDVRMQGLSRVVGPEEADRYPGEVYTVPEARLDDVAALEGLDVAGIKMDVEGFERHVVRGALELLERCRPLVYAELVTEEDRSAVLGAVAGLDYRLGVLEDGRIVAHDPRRHTKHNFFLCPPGGPLG